MRKKETFAFAILGKICYVTCAINRVGKLIWLRACLDNFNRVGLIDKPVSYNRAYCRGYFRNLSWLVVAFIIFPLELFYANILHNVAMFLLR